MNIWKDIQQILESEKVILQFIIASIALFCVFKVFFSFFSYTIKKNVVSKHTPKSTILLQLFAWIVLFFVIKFNDNFLMSAVFVNIFITIEIFILFELLLSSVSKFASKKLWFLTNMLFFLFMSVLMLKFLMQIFIISQNVHNDSTLVIFLRIIMVSVWFIIMINIIDYRFKNTKNFLYKNLCTPIMLTVVRFATFNQDKRYVSLSAHIFYEFFSILLVILTVLKYLIQLIKALSIIFKKALSVLSRIFRQGITQFVNLVPNCVKNTVFCSKNITFVNQYQGNGWLQKLII